MNKRKPIEEKKKYIIVTGNYCAELESEVNKVIDDYEPCGSVYFNPEFNVVSQPMILRKK